MASIEPFAPGGWREFLRGLLEPLGGSQVNRYLMGAWAHRADLRASFPRPLEGDAAGLVSWSWHYGIDEGLSPSLLPPPPSPLPGARRRELAAGRMRDGIARSRRTLARRSRSAVAEARARVLEALERRLDRPLPGARQRIERRVVAAARQARSEYRAEPWPGQVAVITSTEFDEKPTYAAWTARAEGGVRWRRLPFGHVEMLREPGAADLAACLEELIEESLQP